jgi:hypothetical protein
MRLSAEAQMHAAGHLKRTILWLKKDTEQKIMMKQIIANSQNDRGPISEKCFCKSKA